MLTGEAKIKATTQVFKKKNQKSYQAERSKREKNFKLGNFQIKLFQRSFKKILSVLTSIHD